MKISNKICFKAISVICVMGFGCVPNIFAEKMELATDTIKIYGVGQQCKGDANFKSKANFNIPDKIHITELSLTYEESGKKASELSIVEIGGDTLYSNSVKSGLTPAELQKSVRLYLTLGKNYKITHGDKNWNISFANVNSTTIEANDTLILTMARNLGIPQWRIDEGFKIPDGASEEVISGHLNVIAKNIGENTKLSIPWWMYLIIGILGFACVALLLPKMKGVLSRNSNKKTEPKPDGDSSGYNPITPDYGKTHETAEEIKNVTTEVSSKTDDEVDEQTALKMKIDNLLPNDVDLSGEQKIAKIKILLNSGREAKDGISLIRRALNVEDENVAPYFLCDKIDELKNSSSNVSQDTDNRIRGEVSDILINKILEKKNKTLSDVVADAINEKGTNKYEIILKVIDLLSFRMREDSLSITDNQLKHSSNSYILKKWLFEQLNAAGISGIDRNKTVLDNLSQLSSQLQSVRDETPHRSEEEIVDGVILEGRLTELQKKVLISKLIEIINDKIVNSSKSISESISFADFVHSVADALQQPSTQEEAQIQTQQRNIAIVNEALDTDMKSLSKDALEETVKKIVLDILQSKLSNLSIDTYEDALTSLSSCNIQYKELEKVLHGYNADSLEDLPKAIREKQYNDLIKSVSDKVTELLPGQHFDSIQKLVNALFKEVKDAKESRDLIADDLEERISLRDKKYTSSEDNRDVLKLMSIYGNLVNAEDDNLRGQITSKENENSRLKKKIHDKKDTITSLENENKVLMLESQKLVETLHGGAEQILDSCKTILNPCSDDDEAQCVDIEDRLFSDLKSSIIKMKSFTVNNETFPAQMRELIQELLVSEISSENSPVNTVCRFYAYSRLPFMTDTGREYGITFNRKNMSELYDAIENLYVQFNINLNIPSLFVMGIEEGEFENVTGKMYGDLDNLCQNSRNHFDNIDSATKPSNMIVDVVNIGYTIDGKVSRITSVLTY